MFIHPPQTGTAEAAGRGPRADVIAGIGCRAEASPAALVQAVASAFAHHGLRQERLSALAVPPGRADAGRLAARLLGVPLVVIDHASLIEAGSGCLTRSHYSLAATGVGSAAEALALAAMPGTRLAGPRLVCGPVTCAIAFVGAEL
ncbi:cobalamin biosynthesis protein [Pseudoxanthobacter sp.]|uniref:cobalamin biosynthesis protein n=1 Tax=Pseudoxanthobacter sp. TaxID=1925742 RepID=UPI002FE3FC8C